MATSGKKHWPPMGRTQWPLTTLYCGTCMPRLQLDYARNKQGIRYAYYICTGRATRTTTCTRKAVPVGIAEQLVTDCYQQIAITEQTYQQLAQRVEAAFDERLAERSQAIDDLTTTKHRLEAEADKLGAAARLGDSSGVRPRGSRPGS